MRRKALLVPLFVLLAVGVLTGCDPAVPGGGPTATTPASADPSPSGGETTAPVDADTTAHHIAITASYIHIFNAENVAFESIHNGVRAEPVPLFTSVFGFEPTVSHVAGDAHTVGATVYDWSGFAYSVLDEATYTPHTTWYARVTAPTVGGIPIYTGAGGNIQVGDPMADAVAEQIDFIDVPAFDGHPGAYQSHLLPQAIDPVSVGLDASSTPYVFVSVSGAAGGGGAIISFVSPIDSWGL